MDVHTEHTSIYEPPMLAGMGAFTDLTCGLGDEVEEDLDFYDETSADAAF